MTRHIFEIDFNELLEPNLVLLSKGDERVDIDGNLVRLAEGMEVQVRDADLDAEGERDDLIAEGMAVLNTDLGWSRHVKWCCLINSLGIRNMSDLKIEDTP